jgi:glutaminyl-peptide cyclotransferase
MSLRVLVVVLATQVVLGIAVVAWALAGAPSFGLFGHDDTGPAVPYRDDAAYADMKRIAAFGPRPAGSPASRRLAAWLRARLPHGRYEPVPGGLRNVVGELPGRGKAVVLGAHYDTKDIPGFVGANDGAAPDAVVLQVARRLAAARRPADAPPIRFVFFDGEESPRGTPEDDFVKAGLRGSKAYALRHRRDLEEMILVDFVGQPGVQLQREEGSDPVLWARLRAAAKQAGVGAAFPSGTQGRIYDDHLPFAALDIPAVDLIDFDYDCFHELCDRPDQISAHSLAAASRSVSQLLRSGG